MKIVNNNNMKNLAMQRQSLTRIMYCPNCKQEFDGKFCPECGTKLIEKSMRMCPNCKVEVESKFCPECGAKTVEVVEKMVKMCPNCKVETESKFCPECGAKIEEMAARVTSSGDIVSLDKKDESNVADSNTSNQSSARGTTGQKNEPRFCLKELVERMTVVDTGEGSEVWAFDENDWFEEIYTHWKAFCNCPQELQEKKMTKEEMSKFLSQRRGWEVIETVVKYAHYMDEGEHDWEVYEDDCLLFGNYEIQFRVDDEPWLNVNWSAEKKFIDILCNFQVTNVNTGLELIDTMQMDYELMDKLVSVIENVASDSLPLHERFTRSEAEDVFCYDNDANTMKELLKFARAEGELKISDDGLFETPDDFDEEDSYEICFPDAKKYICNWPEDFQDNDDDESEDDESIFRDEECDDAETYYRTAEDYYYGRNGKAQDYEEAVNWYNKAAELGHAEALYSLGYCYEKGEGVDFDEGEAFEWYLKAAELGHLRSQTEVGRLFYMTDQYEEAVPWLLKAGERDDVDAQRLLGYCYEVGLGVDKDKNEAIKWYKRAAAQGDEQAIEELKKNDEQDVD